MFKRAPSARTIAVLFLFLRISKITTTRIIPINPCGFINQFESSLRLLTNRYLRWQNTLCSVMPRTEVDYCFIVEDNICRLIINVDPKRKLISGLWLTGFASSPAIANIFVSGCFCPEVFFVYFDLTCPDSMKPAIFKPAFVNVALEATLSALQRAAGTLPAI